MMILFSNLALFEFEFAAIVDLFALTKRNFACDLRVF